MTDAHVKQQIRAMVRGIYDIQKLRIMYGNRIAAAFRTKLGIEPGTKPTDAEVTKILQTVAKSYDLVTEGYVALPRLKEFKGDSVISTWAELVLVDGWKTLITDEKTQFKLLDVVLQDHPLYDWMLTVRGLGPAMLGVLISEIEIEHAEYPSSLWKYAGLDVAEDGAGRSRREEHLIVREYTDKDGKLKTRRAITFNPFLKTKLMGVLGPSFIKQPADKCVYRTIYDNYRHRLEHSETFLERSLALEEQAKKGGKKYSAKLHRHNMAVRYMVKRFLVDLYKVWRALEGLPIAPEYSEAKLGKIHGKAA